MAKQKVRFLEKDFVPTFGDEFSSIEKPEFDSMIWTTELVEDLVEKVEKFGLDLSKTKHPFFDKNPSLRQGRTAFKMSKHELSEFKKCRKDIVYFANTYIKLMTEEGIVPITLYPYQEEMLLNYKEGRFSIVVGSRQIGKTVVAGIFLTWFLLFHPDKNIMLAANKGDTAKEILDKVKSIISNLPFWLKPGLYSFNAYSIMTDANSRILATTTSKNAAIGFTIHLLFLDEFAHVAENIQRPFFSNIFPVISAGKKTKMIITSTPNGYELFQEIYQKSVDGKNNFTNMSVPWWDVPGRDETWAKEQIAILGEDRFNEQFACQFQRSDLLLLSGDQLKKLSSAILPFEHHQFDVLDRYNLNYDNLLWRSDYDMEKLIKDTIFISIDLAEGIGKDYTVMQIYRLAPKIDKNIHVIDNELFELEKHFFLDQIGIFKDNTMSIDDFAKMCYNILFSEKIINIDKLKVILEWNTYGGVFDEKMKHLFGGDLYDDSVYLKTHHRKGSKVKKIGLRQSSETKSTNCAEIKSLLNKQVLCSYDKWTAQEFNHFTKNKRGSYEASTGHDDCVMAAVNAIEILRHTIFIDMVAEAFDDLDSSQQQAINEAMDNGESLDESTDFLADDYTNSSFGFEHNEDQAGNWF